MEVRVIGRYIVPLVTNDKQNHNEQIHKALEQACYTISRIPAKNIKAVILQNLKVEITNS